MLPLAFNSTGCQSDKLDGKKLVKSVSESWYNQVDWELTWQYPRNSAIASEINFLWG
jgi:hypothetical protein